MWCPYIWYLGYRSYIQCRFHSSDICVIDRTCRVVPIPLKIFVINRTCRGGSHTSDIWVIDRTCHFVPIHLISVLSIVHFVYRHTFDIWVIYRTCLMVPIHLISGLSIVHALWCPYLLYLGYRSIVVIDMPFPYLWYLGYQSYMSCSVHTSDIWVIDRTCLVVPIPLIFGLSVVHAL